MSPLGRPTHPISRIGLGCWQIGAEWGTVRDDVALDILRTAWARGVTLFDTADVYGRGRSERLIGRFLGELGPDRPGVITKCGRFPEPGLPWNCRPFAMRRQVEASMRRLGVDALDLVQLHCVPERELHRGEVFETLRQLRSEGKIKAWGASVESMEEARLCLREPDCASLQVIFNLFRQHPRDAIFAKARARGVAILARLPLASGLLSGRFSRETRFPANDHRHYNRDGAAFHIGETFAGLPFERGLDLVDELRAQLPAYEPAAALALRWILDHEAVTAVIPGASRPGQIAANVAAAELPPLPRALHRRLATFYAERVAPHVRGKL